MGFALVLFVNVCLCFAAPYGVFCFYGVKIMSHLALYRKWRPQTFAGLIGQEEIGRVLRNAILRDRLVHAYLFCGTRGTGKTSTARILAKAVNCLDPKEGEPCNVCASCAAITEGRALDIIEIDAASNRGIDEVRELLEKVHFVPAESRFKVYIIDEAHMLTTEAFNALLKTFEEPPAHVIFILATTEARKVPATIISRCQRFDFKPIGEQKIFAALSDIAQAEQIEADPKALTLLAQKAKGSMRDALSLLDQVMAEGDVSEDKVVALLGGMERNFWPPFLTALSRREAAAVFTAIQDLERQGKDVRVFSQELLGLLGDLLVYAENAGEFSPAYNEFLAQCEGILAADEILTVIAILGEGEMAFRYQKDSKRVLQFLFAKILRSGTVPQTDTAEKKSAAKAPSAPLPAEDTPPWETSLPEEMPAAAKKAKAAGKKSAAAKQPPPINATAEIDKVWRQLMQEIKKISPKTSTWLLPARITALGEDSVTISYGPDGEMHRERITGTAHMEALTKVLANILGRAVDVKIEGGSPKADRESSLF